MPYNATKLDGELKAAGLLIHGVDSTGDISWDVAPTVAQKAVAASVLAAHDPTPLPDHRAEARARLQTLKGKPTLTAKEVRDALNDLISLV